MLNQQIKDNSISVIISTMDDRIGSIVDLVSHEKIKYIVVHQVSSGFTLNNASTLKVKNYLNRKDVLYIYTSELGLSKSRNIGLDNCITKYAHILDDDVKVNDINNLISLTCDFDKYDAHVLISRVITDEGSLFKSYPHNSYKYNTLSCVSVSSIEMAVDVEFLRLHKLKFDERFCLGTSLPAV